MKIILKNSKLEFQSKVKEKSIYLNGGTAYSDTPLFNGSIMIDFVTGNDVDTRGFVFRTNPNNESTKLEVINKKTTVVIKGINQNYLTETLKPNTRYTVIICSNGYSYITGDVTNLLSGPVGSASDTQFIIGNNGISGNIPFNGKIFGIYLKESVMIAKKEFDEWASTKDGCSHSYTPEGINGLVWKDNIGTANLTLTKEPFVE